MAANNERMNEAYSNYMKTLADVDLDDNERMLNEFLYLSLFFQAVFIKSDYAIYRVSFTSVNDTMIRDIRHKINKHPILWKLVLFIFGV